MERILVRYAWDLFCLALAMPSQPQDWVVKALSPMQADYFFLMSNWKLGQEKIQSSMMSMEKTH